LPGFNDSGAHITNMAFFDSNLMSLKLAKERDEATVAHMVKRLTSEPAEIFGLDVGSLKIGAQADMVLINPEALDGWQPDQTRKLEYREIFGHQQMVNRPEGIVDSVYINGVVAWKDGAAQAGTRPGGVGPGTAGRLIAMRHCRARAPRALFDICLTVRCAVHMLSQRVPILPLPRATFTRVLLWARSQNGLWVICLSLFLTACASAPQVADKSTSQFDDPAPAASPLVTLATSEPNSGIRLLADPSDALQSRLQLAALATTTLDIQYYLWQGDNSGLALDPRSTAGRRSRRAGTDTA
jgi:hypothetical protein